MGRQRLLFVIHPDHVRHVLVTGRQGFEKLRTWESSRQLLLGDGLIASTGELWKRQRRLMSGFFTPRSIEQYYPVILAAAEATAQRWDSIAKSGKPIDMGDEMTRVTACIILRAMFGMDISEERLRELEGDVEDMIMFVNRREAQPVKAPLWAPLPSHLRYREARARVHALIRDVIARRRAQPQASWPNDLLSKLMLARDEETGESMSDLLVHDESIGIFIAGHETTARTMAFLWYALHDNPRVAERLRAELDAVVPGDEPPTLEHLKRLPYTLQTIKEVLRLYPPSPAQPRDPVGDRSWGTCTCLAARSCCCFRSPRTGTPSSGRSRTASIRIAFSPTAKKVAIPSPTFRSGAASGSASATTLPCSKRTSSRGCSRAASTRGSSPVTDPGRNGRHAGRAQRAADADHPALTRAACR
jgi:cytochrome P450